VTAHRDKTLRPGLSELVSTAKAGRYAVPAFNVVDSSTLAGVLDAAAEASSLVIVQLSVRMAKFWGPAVVAGLFEEMARDRGVPAVLHLDHCQDMEFAKLCLTSGWDSVLVDASLLPYEEAVRTTAEIVEVARQYGGFVEGEFEQIRYVNDFRPVPNKDVEADAGLYVDFVTRTGVCCLCPDIGTMHGQYTKEPDIDFDRVKGIAAAVPVPLVLHGSTGLRPSTVTSLINCGMSKVNFSTGLKEGFITALKAALDDAGNYLAEPYDIVKKVRAATRQLCLEQIELVGSAGSFPS
jgi:ketose-bisphosphate aldolase